MDKNSTTTDSIVDRAVGVAFDPKATPVQRQQARHVALDAAKSAAKK